MTNTEEKWQEYQERFEKLFIEGLKKGLVLPYDEELISKLRNIYYGGLPLSISLLSEQLCSGNCYEMALLMTLAFSDDHFRLVDADIDGITLNPEKVRNYGSIPHYGNHCFVERLDDDGVVWVYDTSSGFVIERELYYQMENPVVTCINDKSSVLDFRETLGIDGKLNEDDLDMLPLILPNIESSDQNQSFVFDYANVLGLEIEMFKDFIGYDEMCDQLENEVKSFFW